MKRLTALLLLLALLCGCAPATSLDVSDRAPEESRRLVLFSCLEESVTQDLVKEFEERTGIWVQVESGSAPELLARIAEDKGYCDLILGCGADTLEANRESFRPCPLPEETVLTGGCPTGEAWVPVSLGALVIVYNPKLVRLNLPTGWASLLDPAWQGKIAFADPESSGFSRTALFALTRIFPDSDPEALLAAFARQLPVLLEDAREAVQRVADGSFCLAVVPEDAALSGMGAGSDLAIVYPAEGTCLAPDCAAIPNDCPHPDNALAFVAFLLGDDAQNRAWESHARRPVLSGLVSLPEGSLMLDPVSAGQTQRELLALWAEIWEATP